MHVSRRSSLATLSLVFAGAALAACQRTTSKPIETGPAAPPVSPLDLDFVTNAWAVIHFDQELCQQAAVRSRNRHVKALAQKILAYANGFDGELKMIAAKKGISPPKQLRSDLAVRLTQAEQLNGVYFDKMFVADEIATHEEALARAEEMSADPAADPQIKAFLAKAHDDLKTNLELLEKLQAHVGPPVYQFQNQVRGGGGGGGG